VNLGIAYSQTGQFDEAESFLIKAMELEPDTGFSYLNLGANLEKQERYAEAISIYKKAIGLKKSNPQKLYSNLSMAYQKLNDYANSIKYAKLAISKNPNRYGHYMLLGRAYFKAGNYQEAENIYQKTLKLFPGKSDAYVRLGAVYERQNRLEEALSILNIALTRKDTDAAKAYNTLGIIYWRLKKYQDSVNAAQQAIAINPGLLDAYLTLGLTYEDMGMQDLALAQFRKAWQQGYDMVATYNYWAIYFMRQNDTGRAILYLQEALKLQPDHPESLKNLAEAYLLKNK
jgi:tetratricopeptide (TPR) repeat protein